MTGACRELSKIDCQKPYAQLDMMLKSRLHETISARCRSLRCERRQQGREFARVSVRESSGSPHESAEVGRDEVRALGGDEVSAETEVAPHLDVRE